MADRSILVRLKLAAQEFSDGVKIAFDEVGDEAEAAGGRAGQRFSAGMVAKGTLMADAGKQVAEFVARAVANSVDLAVSLDETSKQLGINVERLQEYQYAAAQAGVSQSELENGLGDLTRRIGDAVDGNNKARQSFVDLGVGIVDTNGKVRVTETIFQDVAKQLFAIEDPTERAARGAALLGDEYGKLEPMLREIADGTAGITAEMREQNAYLTEKQIQTLVEANREWEKTKQILSVRIAQTIADNADAIITLAGSLETLANWAGTATRAWRNFNLERERKLNNNAINGWFTSDDRRVSLMNRNLEINDELYGIQSGSSLPAARDTRGTFGVINDTLREITGSTSLSRILAPTGSARRTGGRSRSGGGGSRRAGKSDEQREAERAAQEAIRNEERLRDAVEKTLQRQQDAIYLADLRAEKGEDIAAQEEARLSLVRQFPALEAQTVQQLAASYGIEGDITEEKRLQLERQLAQNAAALDGAIIGKKREQADRDARKAEEAADRAREKKAEEDKRAQDKLDAEFKAQQKIIYQDLADFYFDVFSGNTGNIWKDFKRQGKGVLAELAAQLTLSAINGQPLSFGNALANVLGQGPNAGGGSPLGTLLGGIGGLFGGGKTSGVSAVAGGNNILNAGSDIAMSAAGSGGAGALGSIGAAGPIGAAFAAQQIVGDLLGFDSTATAFGGLIGGFIHSLFKKTPAGQSSITSIDGTPRISATKSGVTDNLSSISSEFQASLRRIADALDADVGTFGVSIGQRKDYFRVSGNPNYDTGQKNVSGLLYDGKDPEAAIRAALGDALADGAIKGISDASQRILASGQDIERAIEKALMIEEIPKRLQARLDPLGFALDQIDKQFTELADVLKEGGASAEQITQARQLWELERADAIREIGDASEGLKDYLLSLNAGSNSPLSLRQQEREAEEALKPYLDQIGAAESARAELDRLRAAGADDATIKAAEDAARTAAGQIDQSGFQDAAQLLLGISRSANASGSGFFEQFDRIRGLTNSAIGSIDNAVPIRGQAVDPFTELTANAAQATANILDSHTGLLQSINNNLAALLAGGGGSGQFTLEDRFFTVAS